MRSPEPTSGSILAWFLSLGGKLLDITIAARAVAIPFR